MPSDSSGAVPPLGPPHGGLPQGAPAPRGPGGPGFLRRKGVRPALTTLSVVLFLAGAGLLAWPLMTDLYTAQLQRGLENHYADNDLARQYQARTLADDDPLTRMIIPSLDVDILVVAGITESALRAGAGHYPMTPLPGEEGNVGIAAHRTTYGRPLEHAEQLVAGDEVILDTPLATHTYEVVPAPGDAARPCGEGACWITGPRDWSVVDELDGHYLTLTTCHPRGSDAERLVVRAELVDTEPREATGATG